MNEAPFFTISLNLDYIYNKLHQMKLDKYEKNKKLKLNQSEKNNVRQTESIRKRKFNENEN